MQKSKQVFSIGQQSKFQQLQLEVAALEKQVENVLREQLTIANSHNPQPSIPLVYVNEQVAQSGNKGKTSEAVTRSNLA
ncbi:MAG: hypothetical protein AAF652_19035 [Cyanobacteria bacterium P01_C01_bin.72]